MIKLEDGQAVNMGDTVVIQQVDEHGKTNNVVVTPQDILHIQAVFLGGGVTSAASI